MIFEPTKKRRTVSRPEEELQRALVDYLELLPRTKGRFWHVPNQRKTGYIRGILHALGVRSGVPDLQVAVVTPTYPGLFIELKAPGGTLSESQAAMLKRLAAQGYCCCTCWNIDHALAVVDAYLAGGKVLGAL
jgi:hypothetical protein